MDLVVLLDRSEPALESGVSDSNFALFCSPAINLFPRRTDRIDLADRFHEYHVVVDRTRPLDFEVFEISEVVGYGAAGEREREFLPFYGTTDRTPGADRGGHFAARRAQSAAPEHGGGG